MTSHDHDTRSREEVLLQRYFLDRLRHLVLRTIYVHPHLAPHDFRHRFLNRAILSVYGDCRALGVGEEARVILHALRHDLSEYTARQPSRSSETPNRD